VDAGAGVEVMLGIAAVTWTRAPSPTGFTERIEPAG
jgi:hypothetical protein